MERILSSPHLGIHSTVEMASIVCGLIASTEQNHCSVAR